MWIEREETIQGTPEDVYSYIQQVEKKYGNVSTNISISLTPEIDVIVKYNVWLDKKVNITWEERT